MGDDNKKWSDSIPAFFGREAIKQGGTNPDYLGDLAGSIIAETQKQTWSTSYLMEKIDSMRRFVEWESRRHENLLKMASSRNPEYSP